MEASAAEWPPLTQGRTWFSDTDEPAHKPMCQAWGIHVFKPSKGKLEVSIILYTWNCGPTTRGS